MKLGFFSLAVATIVGSATAKLIPTKQAIAPEVRGQRGQRLKQQRMRRGLTCVITNI